MFPLTQTLHPIQQGCKHTHTSTAPLSFRLFARSPYRTMDKYEQFEIEQRALMRALETDGPSEALAARLKALYRDAGVVVALGPSRSVPRDDDLPDDEADFDPELDPNPDAMPMADDRDMDYYIRALDSGALTPIFAHAPWGEVSLRYEALVMDDKVCPGLRACWSDPLAFLAEGKADEGFNTRIEGMVGAFGRMVSAEWWRWQVRVV